MVGIDVVICIVFVIANLFVFCYTSHVLTAVNDVAVICLFPSCPLPSSRQRLCSGACLGDKREDNQNCSVLCCVRKLCTMICTRMWAVLTFLHIRFRFLFLCLFRFCFCMFFHVSLDLFVHLVLAFVVLGLVSSVLSQEMAGMNVSVWMGCKTLTHSINQRVSQLFTKKFQLLVIFCKCHCVFLSF